MPFLYNEGRFQVWKRTAPTLDVVADTLKVMLLTNAYTLDRDHDLVSSLSAAELTGTGYVAGFGGAGRKTLTTKVLSRVDASDLVKLMADSLTWAAINAGTIRYAAVIKEITSDALSLPVALIDINPTAGYLTDGNDWTLTCPTNGFLQSTSP